MASSRLHLLGKIPEDSPCRQEVMSVNTGRKKNDKRLLVHLYKFDIPLGSLLSTQVTKIGFVVDGGRIKQSGETSIMILDPRFGIFV